MSRALIFGVALCLAGCTTTNLPDGFIYDTSLRGQQGWYGTGARRSAAEDLLSQAVVTSPQMKLEATLPDSDIELRKWGLTYFDKDWTRYRVFLDADIKRDGETTKCRLSEPEAVEDAPLLRELEADGGALIQSNLDKLVASCVDEVLNPTSP